MSLRQHPHQQRARSYVALLEDAKTVTSGPASSSYPSPLHHPEQQQKKRNDHGTDPEQAVTMIAVQEEEKVVDEGIMARLMMSVRRQNHNHHRDHSHHHHHHDSPATSLRYNHTPSPLHLPSPTTPPPTQQRLRLKAHYTIAPRRLFGRNHRPHHLNLNDDSFSSSNSNSNHSNAAQSLSFSSLLSSPLIQSHPSPTGTDTTTGTTSLSEWSTRSIFATEMVDTDCCSSISDALQHYRREQEQQQIVQGLQDELRSTKRALATLHGYLDTTSLFTSTSPTTLFSAATTPTPSSTTSTTDFAEDDWDPFALFTTPTTTTTLREDHEGRHVGWDPSSPQSSSSSSSSSFPLSSSILSFSVASEPQSYAPADSSYSSLVIGWLQQQLSATDRLVQTLVRELDAARSVNETLQRQLQQQLPLPMPIGRTGPDPEPEPDPDVSASTTTITSCTPNCNTTATTTTTADEYDYEYEYYDSYYKYYRRWLLKTAIYAAIGLYYYNSILGQWGLGSPPPHPQPELVWVSALVLWMCL